MYILIDKDTLQEALGLAGKFTINKFTTTTHLQGVLLKAEKGELHIISTNLNLYFHKKIKIKEKALLKAVIEPKNIVEYLSFLPAGKIGIEVKDNQFIITKDKDRGAFPVIDAADFPPLPKTEKEKPQKISTSFLEKNLPLVFFSASTDDSRPTLTGINFLTQDNDLIIVSTDGFRLSLVRKTKDFDIPEMLISGKFLEEVLRASKGEKEILLYFSNEDKTAHFKVGDTSFYSRLIEGDFPAFEKVIPSEIKTTAVFDREETLQKIRRAAVFAREYSNIIIFEVKKDGITISPKTDGGSSGSQSFQEAEVKGEDQRVAFNFRFVFDLLNSAKSKKATMELLRPDAPAVFKEEGRKDFIHIIMPIRINA